ncbi:MAG: TolC family protein [Crocinitomix sp.]|nr:TolC family protein [Crocinitomix sp.]
MQFRMNIKITLFCFLPFIGIGQEALDLEEAFAIALENNYDIELANNSLQKADNSQSIYNSGFLPTATVSGNANYSNTDLTLTTQQGIKESIDGVATTNYGGSLGIQYLIYNGGSRKFQYDRLKKMYEISDAQLKLQIETTFINVYTSFFNVAKNQEQKRTLESAYKASKDRQERVTAQNKYGKKSNLDVLNAQVDSNSDSLQVLTISMQLENNKRNLNLLLGREINFPFDVNSGVVLDNSLSYNTLLESMYSANMQLKELELNKYVSEIDLKNYKSAYLPTLSTSVSYAVNNSENGPAGLFANQLSNGLNAGVSLSWNVFDGGATKVRVQNAKIDLESQKIYEQRLKKNLENQLATYWAEYTTQQIIIKNETINVAISEQNFLKSKEQYDLGQITALEYRQAQLNLINTQLNLLNAKYNAKLAELQLKILTANLLN